MLPLEARYRPFAVTRAAVRLGALMPDTVEKLAEHNSWVIFCRSPAHLRTNDSHKLRCSNHSFAKSDILGEIPTFSTISPLKRPSRSARELAH
jgi:hypothetical protein